MMSLSVQHEEAAKNAITIVNGVLSELSTPERLAEYYDRETGYTCFDMTPSDQDSNMVEMREPHRPVVASSSLSGC